PTAQRLHQRLLFLGERALDRLQSPLLGNPSAEVEQAFHAVEVRAAGEIEAVVQRLVLDQARAREEVEIVDAVRDDVLLQRFEQRQELARRDRQLRGFEMEEEV